MLVSATPVPLLDEMWQKLKSNQLTDRYQIRVFDGHIHTLIEDNDFYEFCGHRRRINGLLTCWDIVRNYALKDEKEQKLCSPELYRTEDEKKEMELKIKFFDGEFNNFCKLV